MTEQEPKPGKSEGPYIVTNMNTVLRDKNRDVVIELDANPRIDLNRIAELLNAFQGIESPAEFMKAVKELEEQLGFHLCKDNCDPSVNFHIPECFILAKLQASRQGKQNV